MNHPRRELFVISTELQLNKPDLPLFSLTFLCLLFGMHVRPKKLSMTLLLVQNQV